MTRIKDEVKQYLEESDTTTEKLAGELDMSRSALFNKLNGSNEFTLPEAYKLSRILGCTLDEFFVMTAA